jgi:hypothetical protein
MNWTEERIAQSLNGHLYQLQQMSLGKFTVVDLNEPEDELPAEPAPAPVVETFYTASPRADGSLSFNDIGKVVTEVFGVTRLELESQRRNPHLVRARHTFYWLARRFTACSFPQMGAWFNRDHTSVLHGVKKVDRRFQEYSDNIAICMSRLGVSLDKEAA